MNRTNLNILYEDSHIIVCVKPHGIAKAYQAFIGFYHTGNGFKRKCFAAAGGSQDAYAFGRRRERYIEGKTGV